MIRVFLFIWIVSVFFVNPVGGQEPSPGAIGIHERLGQSVPLNLTFYDEKGSKVRLSDLINKPTILTLVYYNCSHFCPQMLLGLSEVLAELKMIPGKDYGVITISIDEQDTPENASSQRINYVKAINSPFPDDAWRFLTGDRESIMKIADALGITFKRDTHGFIHPEAVVFLSPQGKITRYIYASKYSFGVGIPITFSAIDFTKALTGASVGKVEAGVRTSPLLCFPHEPGRQEKFFDVMKILGVITLASVASLFVYLNLTANKASKKDEDHGE